MSILGMGGQRWSGVMAPGIHDHERPQDTMSVAPGTTSSGSWGPDEACISFISFHFRVTLHFLCRNSPSLIFRLHHLPPNSPSSPGAGAVCVLNKAELPATSATPGMKDAEVVEWMDGWVHDE